MKLFLPENILTILLKQEDTDNDKRITVEDKGPKRIVLESEAGPVIIEGTYFLSNLLQEIILAGEANKTWVESDLVFEKPAALNIWLASLAETVGLVSAKAVVLKKARVESIRMVVFIFVL